MKIAEEIVLSPGVEVVPVTSVANLLRQKGIANFGDHDYLINWPNSRVNPKIVSRDLGEILLKFTKPNLLVNAVIDFSSTNNSNPEKLLDEVYPSFKALLRADLLIPSAESGASNENVSLLTAGQVFRQYTVVRQIQYLKDTQVYLITDGADHFVLKVWLPRQAGDVTENIFHNEIRILKLLDNTINPRLIESGDMDQFPYAVIEWIDNVALPVYAAELRKEQKHHELLALAKNIVGAYASLHAQSVLHNDLNPRNILVRKDGSIKLIDFGLSTAFSEPLKKMNVSSVDFFSSPEKVAYKEQGQAGSTIDPLGEQFSLGAVLYFLVTGHHYTNFSPDKIELMEAIKTNQPQSFSAFHATAYPGLERILNKALAKSPEARYPDLRHFFSDIKSIELPPRETVTEEAAVKSKNETLIPGPSYFLGVSMKFESICDQVKPTPAFLNEYFHTSPSCSINFGGAGIAYFFYKSSIFSYDANLLSSADIWINHSIRKIVDPESLYNPAIGLTPKEIKGDSLFHKPIGLYYIKALINSAMNDITSFKESVGEFINAYMRHDTLDITLGRAGILTAAASLWEARPSSPYFNPTPLHTFGSGLLADFLHLFQQPKTKGLDWITSTGMAHGWCGFIYATLRWYQATATMPGESVKASLENLLNLREVEGNIVRWKNKVSSSKYYYAPGWCNGSAGFLQLLSLAYQLFDDERYLTLAAQVGLDVYENQDSLSDLCCGLTGRAYALLSLHTMTTEKKYLRQAEELLVKAEKANRYLKDLGLFKGKLGTALLSLELQSPASASFPIMSKHVF